MKGLWSNQGGYTDGDGIIKATQGVTRRCMTKAPSYGQGARDLCENLQMVKPFKEAFSKLAGGGESRAIKCLFVQPIMAIS